MVSIIRRIAGSITCSDYLCPSAPHNNTKAWNIVTNQPRYYGDKYWKYLSVFVAVYAFIVTYSIEERLGNKISVGKYGFSTAGYFCSGV